MKTIVIGAGKIGYSIAQTLSQENHRVVVIDIDEERLETVDENLDVKVVLGNGANAKDLLAAGVEEVDLLIAMTNNDELNMVSCFIAKSYGAKMTIARVSDPDYADIDQSVRQQALGIDLIVNPEKVTAHTIGRLVSFPEAHSVEYFADGKVQMLELTLPEDAPVVGKFLRDLRFPKQALIVSIHRNGQMLIPRGDDQLLPGDIIFVLSETVHMRDVIMYMIKRRKKIENTTVLGGGYVGLYLAERLQQRKIRVKILEPDIKRCKELNEKLSDVLVINGDGTDLQLLEEENIGSMDVFIAASDDDKLNLLACILAKHLGCKKTIAQIRRSDYVTLIEKVGIDRAVSPRQLMISAVMQFIRRGELLSLTLLDSNRARIIEMMVSEKSRVANKALKDMNFPHDALIGAFVRNAKVIVPNGSDKILPGDRVIVFALPDAVQKAEDYIIR